MPGWCLAHRFLNFYSFSDIFFSLFSLAACPPGTFKSTQGSGLCLQCPPNSRSTSEAATICVCRNGYYRGDADQPDEPCTSEFIVYDITVHTHTHALTLLHTWHILMLTCSCDRHPCTVNAIHSCDINIE